MGRMNWRPKNAEQGFTLIELMVVVLIVGVLAAIALPVFGNVQTNAHKATVKSDVRNTVTNIAGYLASNPEADFVDAAALTVTEGNCLIVAGGYQNYTVEGSSQNVQDWGLHYDVNAGTYYEHQKPACETEPTIPAEPAPTDEPVTEQPEPVTPTPEPSQPVTPPVTQEPVTPAPAPSAPSLTAPQGLTADRTDGNRTLNLTWRAVENATSYQISYDVCTNGKNCYEGDTSTTATKHTIKSADLSSKAGPITSYVVSVSSNAGEAGSTASIVKGNF